MLVGKLCPTPSLKVEQEGRMEAFKAAIRRMTDRECLLRVIARLKKRHEKYFERGSPKFSYYANALQAAMARDAELA